ncbi:MAG: hypothetical protein HYT15_04505 [Candidatus Magasanikbacteria bacterium]|nr:hypothetical protein [Candidatus Magasanikbacteria bacterium]
MNNPDPFDPPDELDQTLHGDEVPPTTTTSDETGEDDESTADTMDRNRPPSDGSPLADEAVFIELGEIADAIDEVIDDDLKFDRNQPVTMSGQIGTAKSSPAHDARLHQWKAINVDASIGGGTDASNRLP